LITKLVLIVCYQIFTLSKDNKFRMHIYNINGDKSYKYIFFFGKIINDVNKYRKDDFKFILSVIKI